MDAFPVNLSTWLLALSPIIVVLALMLGLRWGGSKAGPAGWITVFVEVPLATFSPVKTVLDLLRDEHQPPR